MPATDRFRCIPLEIGEVVDGRILTSSYDAGRYPFFRSVEVCGATGEVRMTGIGRQTWRILTSGPAEDLVLLGPHPIDGIWIRHWKEPITFMAMFFMTTIITGTCEVLPSGASAEA